LEAKQSKTDDVHAIVISTTKAWNRRGFAKVRHRGLVKNANRAFAMLALYHLVKWGRPLTGEVRPA
jgi:IS5 family transposase